MRSQKILSVVFLLAGVCALDLRGVRAVQFPDKALQSFPGLTEWARVIPGAVVRSDCGRFAAGIEPFAQTR